MTGKLLTGEVVSWTSPREVAYSTVVDAASTSGIDKKMLREMLPRNAFARAANELEGRMFNTVEDDGGEMTVQVTREFLDTAGKEYRFEREAFLKLNKTTGVVTSEDSWKLANLMERMLREQIKVRKARDITGIVQRVFEKGSGDLVPIRPSGGAYFVPSPQLDLVSKVEKFLDLVGGEIVRFEVSGSADSKTSRSIAGSMKSYFESLVSEFRRTCEDVSPDSSARVIESRRLKMKALRLKMETLREYMSDHADDIKAALDQADTDLENKKRGVAVKPYEPYSMPAGPVETEDSEDVVVDPESEDETEAIGFSGLLF